MTKDDIDRLINEWGASLPERLTGNEENAILAERLEPFVQSDRQAVVELMREWLSVRTSSSKTDPDYGKKVGTMWLALRVAEKYHLHELRPDIEALVADVRAGRTFLPYYAEMIEKYLAGRTG